MNYNFISILFIYLFIIIIIIIIIHNARFQLRREEKIITINKRFKSICKTKLNEGITNTISISFNPTKSQLSGIAQHTINKPLNIWQAYIQSI